MTKSRKKNGRDGKKWPPFKSEMQDLSNLKTTHALSLSMRLAFPNKERSVYPARNLHVCFVRLVDKTIIEYESARYELERYVNNTIPIRPLTALLRAGAHFENCITSLHRSCRFLEQIKRDKRSPGLPSNLESILRSAKRIADFRNGIQHMEEDVLKGNLGPGGRFGIKVNSDSIECRSYSIQHDELGTWIKKLHGYAKKITYYYSTR